MSGFYYSQQNSPSDEDDFDFNQPFQPTQQPASQRQAPYQQHAGQGLSPSQPQGPVYNQPQQFYQQPEQYMQPQQLHRPQPQQCFGYQPSAHYQAAYDYPMTPVSSFVTPTVPSNYPYHPQPVAPFPLYTEAANSTPRLTSAGPSGTSAGYLSPDEASRTRASRSTSFASNRSSVRSYSHSDVSTRSVSPNAGEMQRWGYQNDDGTWSCRYPGCASKSTFSRGCDLRKHYKRHTKSLFCRVEGCPQATEGGFSSKKDRARHEAKHNPNVVCEWEGCDRLFSRVDNMVRSCGNSLDIDGTLITYCRRIMCDECTGGRAVDERYRTRSLFLEHREVTNRPL